MKLKEIIPSEHQEQCFFIEWFRYEYPKIRIFAIPNGTRASIGASVKAKKEGVSSGVPDLYIPEWKIWIEMKRQKKGVLSKNQKEWITYLESIGDTVLVGKGAEDAINQLNLVVYKLHCK